MGACTRCSKLTGAAAPSAPATIRALLNECHSTIIFSDPYAELEGQELYLSTDVLSTVKRSSSYTQVSDHRNYSIQPKFVQRRHSLTSINGKGSPIEVQWCA